jgi:acyl-CoA synthetase (AMP-forming)/AMP-acid ligase II
MYAGLIPAPLNPLLAAPHLSAILRHCSAQALLASDTQLGAARAAASACARGLRLDLLERMADASPPRPKAAAPGREAPADSDAALLIYTSGTVDRPKGALFSHANLLACARNAARAHALSCQDRFLSVLPLCHMNAIDKLLGTISAGASAVLVPRFQVDQFWRLIVEYQCTWGSLVPTLIAQLVNRNGPDREALAAMRYVRSSSAPLPAFHRELFEDKFGIPVREGMGMTEAGSVFMNPPPPGMAKPGSVGLAPGFEVKILGPQGKPLPSEESGSIWLRGPAIMQGYHGDHEWTAKR